MYARVQFSALTAVPGYTACLIHVAEGSDANMNNDVRINYCNKFSVGED